MIASHVVLFDFIGETQEKGKLFERALLDAGIMRLRPVMVTVGATVVALLPLALQRLASLEALVLLANRRRRCGDVHHLTAGPCLMAIFVVDLKLVKWEGPRKTDHVKRIIGIGSIRAAGVVSSCVGPLFGSSRPQRGAYIGGAPTVVIRGREGNNSIRQAISCGLEGAPNVGLDRTGNT